MRVTKRGLVLSTLLIAIVAVLVAFCIPGPRPIDVPLADGSVLHLVQIRYAPWEQPKLGGAGSVVKETLRGWWLKYKYGARVGSFTGSGSGWGSSHPWHPDAPALQIWLTRSFPNAANKPGIITRIDVDSVHIVDSDGCVFPATQTGGAFENVVETDIRKAGSVEVSWFCFEAFPRHEKELQLQFYEYSVQRKLMVEVKIANPAFKSAGKSAVAIESLPITTRAGEVAFTLKGVSLKDNYKDFLRGEWLFGHPHEIVPDLEVLDAGRPVPNREALDFELRDASGNFASKMYDNSLFLCPREESWTLRVKYFGGTNADPQLSAIWKVSGLKVPAPGQLNLQSATNLIQGVPIKITGFCGPGSITYSSNAPSAAAPVDLGGRKPSRSQAFYSGWPGTVVNTYVTSNYHLAFELGKMAFDQRLTVLAKDDQGRVFEAYSYDWDWGRPGPRFVYKPQSEDPLLMYLDLPADSKIIDLTIAIRRPRVVEFIVKPPGAVEGKK